MPSKWKSYLGSKSFKKDLQFAGNLLYYGVIAGATGYAGYKAQQFGSQIGEAAGQMYAAVDPTDTEGWKNTLVPPEPEEDDWQNMLDAQEYDDDPEFYDAYDNPNPSIWNSVMQDIGESRIPANANYELQPFTSVFGEH